MTTNDTPAQQSGIQWPQFATPTRAGPEWLNAHGFNQAISDCQSAYNRHVEVYDSHPSQTHLIAGWPRGKSHVPNQQEDFVEGYSSAMVLIEKAFQQAQEQKISTSENPPTPTSRMRR